ncbi:homocysteine S-methyltransferase family protein [Planctomycetota bacterium]
MSVLLDKLSTGKVLLLDGAMGTTLQKRGLKPGQCPESWNVSQPHKIQQVIAEYVAVGADIVETNSFGGTSFKLKQFGLADKVFEYNNLAAQISRRAAGKNVLVAGSIGPTGQFLQPLGEVSEQDMYLAYQQQVTALADGGADVFFIETMMALDEAHVAFRAARQNTQLPVVVSFTFEKNANGLYRTIMGVSPEQVAAEFTAAGADIIGSNCGSGIVQMIDICREIAQHTDKYIFIKPNAGLPVLENGQTVFKETPEQMAEHVDELIDCGVNLFGGCCGTTAEHIKAFRQILDAHN